MNPDVSVKKPFYLVIDFEANCSSNNSRDHEIIEFPAVLVDAQTGETLVEFRQFVNTVFTGPVSKFITELTGITADQIYEQGVDWSECMKLFHEWCVRNGVHRESTTVVTCGDWDLKTMLPRQLMLTKTRMTPRLEGLFACWNNVKIEYRNAHGYRKAHGMAAMLIDMDIELVGRHHSGIDDCRNIASICHALFVRKGCDLSIPNRMWNKPLWYLSPPEMPCRRTKAGKIVDRVQEHPDLSTAFFGGKNPVDYTK
jgi:ERI1 exoribonuclease 3